jgi:glutathione S-transferase
MYRLYGIPTQNTLKVGYVLDAVGVSYEFKLIDLSKKEQKSEAFLKINPVGKVPALQHNDFSMFESGAMCRYVANVENSALYPEDKMLRAQVDQWLDFFSAHLGRWLSTLFFEKVLKSKMGFGQADSSKCEEAQNFVLQQIEPVEKQLSQNNYFVGDKITIADYAAFAYIDQTTALQFDLSAYPSLKNWHDKMSLLSSIKKTKSTIKF